MTSTCDQQQQHHSVSCMTSPHMCINLVPHLQIRLQVANDESHACTEQPQRLQEPRQLVASFKDHELAPAAREKSEHSKRLHPRSRHAPHTYLRCSAKPTRLMRRR